MPKKKSVKEIIQEKSDKVLNGVAYWASFYRCNPQRFAKDFLNLELKKFQKILIFEMMHNVRFMYIAARGQGKTYLIALFCVIRCILYPGSKIIVASGIKEQAIEVIRKIDEDFLLLHDWGSANLRNEIKEISTNPNSARVIFKNGSFIRVVAANKNARSKRANILFCDEFVYMDEIIINEVLRKFLTSPRQPGYLSKPEYKHLAERNIEMFASSAYYTSHWSFKKFRSYFVNMLNDTKKYFVCALSYQISIAEGLLMKEDIEDTMSEADFDPFSFKKEMEAIFLGSDGDAFFDFENIAQRRKIKKAFYPLEIYRNHHIAIPDLMFKEKRILSVDVALMSSKRNKNDAASLWINSAIPTDNEDYITNLVYSESHEGLTTDDLGLIIMRTFYQYKCTHLVLDTNGSGLGVYDYIIKPEYDPDYGVTYDAMTCVNDEEMASRCKVRNANKVIYSIKANESFNSNAAKLLRAGILNGNINLLRTEVDIEDELKNIRGYKQFTPHEQALLKIPYVQTTFLINELINLEYEVKGVNVRVYERSGMRKDRYSSIMMNYKICQDLAVKEKPRKSEKSAISQLPIIKARRIRVK